MNNVEITRRRSVATFLWQVDDRVAFTYGGEEHPEWYYMNADQWVDMGKPEKVTLTVEPGDSLN